MNHIIPADTIDLNKIEQALFKTIEYCRTQDYAGYNKYDALDSPILSKVSLGNQYLRLIYSQLIMRSPLNIRPLFLIPKTCSNRSVRPIGPHRPLLIVRWHNITVNLSADSAQINRFECARIFTDPEGIVFCCRPSAQKFHGLIAVCERIVLHLIRMRGGWQFQVW